MYGADSYCTVKKRWNVPFNNVCISKSFTGILQSLLWFKSSCTFNWDYCTTSISTITGITKKYYLIVDTPCTLYQTDALRDLICSTRSVCNTLRQWYKFSSKFFKSKWQVAGKGNLRYNYKYQVNSMCIANLYMIKHKISPTIVFCNSVSEQLYYC